MLLLPIISTIKTAGSGEEMVINSYPRFIVRIKLGFVVSYKANGFSLMKFSHKHVIVSSFQRGGK